MSTIIIDGNGDITEGPPDGDMTKAVYDPNLVEGDAFQMDNMVEGATAKILTDIERGTLTNRS